MAPTSNEDLQAKRDHVQDLREKIAKENAARETRERELANDVEAAVLDTEATRLEAELAAAKAANTKAAVVAGVEAPLTALADDQARAQAQLDAASKPAEKAGDKSGSTGTDK